MSKHEDFEDTGVMTPEEENEYGDSVTDCVNDEDSEEVCDDIIEDEEYDDEYDEDYDDERDNYFTCIRAATCCLGCEDCDLENECSMCEYDGNCEYCDHCIVADEY